MTRAKINPGISNMVSVVEVTKLAKRKVKVEITSDCENVARLRPATSELNPFEASKVHVDSIVYKSASENHLFAACPVPMAILKAIKIENGLALPRPVPVHFVKTE